MTLQNFETHISQRILMRGLDYYESGNIASLEFDGEEWVADIEGSDDYTVTVKLSKNGDILDTSCDCPYDWGEYCKHQAAVFYALKNNHQALETSGKAAKKERLEDMLQKLDKQALLSIVLEFAGRDRRIKEELSLRYANENDILKRARNAVKSAIAAVKRKGFVEYRDVARATDGADTVLEMADSKIECGDILSAVSLCVVVLEEMRDLLDCCDDSDGFVGGSINEAIEKIGESVEALPPGREGGIFDVIFSHAQSPIYNDWSHWRLGLLSAAIPLCEKKEHRTQMEEYLSERCGNARQSDGHSDYESRQMQSFHANMIKRLDGEAAADIFMEKHIDNHQFRKTLIQSAISEKQYDRALRLCLDGEWEDERHARQWKPLRYTIYEKTGDKDGQRKLGQELLTEGVFDYYAKLKVLYTTEEWQSTIQNILDKITSHGRYGVYVKILVQEKLKLRLLEYCKKYPQHMISYYEHLLPEYSHEVGEILMKLIRESASRASTRSVYSDICQMIRCYGKACGKEAMYALRDELMGKHKRRRAFLDELRKI